MAVWPDAPREAILYAQFHDVGEVGTGDSPYPIKADNPLLKSEMDRLEGESCSAMGLMHHLTIEPYWRNRVKICDVIEMWEFGQDEVALGNSFAGPIVVRMTQLRRTLAQQFGLSDDEIMSIHRYEAWRSKKQP